MIYLGRRWELKPLECMSGETSWIRGICKWLSACSASTSQKVGKFGTETKQCLTRPSHRNIRGALSRLTWKWTVWICTLLSELLSLYGIFLGKGDHITMLPFISGNELVLLVILRKGSEVCISIFYHEIQYEFLIIKSSLDCDCHERCLSH
jgi:hypothetical protein